MSFTNRLQVVLYVKLLLTQFSVQLEKGKENKGRDWKREREKPRKAKESQSSLSSISLSSLRSRREIPGGREKNRSKEIFYLNGTSGFSFLPLEAQSLFVLAKDWGFSRGYSSLFPFKFDS
uniref:Uncharacterized protein n=1 Tax=Salix viminalis TaxID=40686 RepID=A0A6N2K3L2_SALVM